jgi:glycosyltransferase involved in cell wall biosynthesis
MLGVTYIPCLHGGNLPERIKKWPALSKKLFGGAYINVAVSGYLQQPMAQHGWPSTVIPNPINIRQYPFKHRAACRPRLLWVRSFHQLYNPQLAVRVLANLSAKYADAALTMVGPDKDGSLAQCTQLAKQLGVESKMAFKGFLSKQEWVQLAADHDIFINTTNFDNLPVSVIEAMALGMPVISTNVGGLPWLVEDGITGLLVPANDEAVFTAAIEKIVANPPLADALSGNARQAAENYDWKNVGVLWHTLLDSIL